MSTIKSSNEHLTINADGSSKDIKFQANGVEKASISSAGAFTSTTIDATKLTGDLPAISGANLTGVGVAGITSSADATAMTIDSGERIGIGNTVAGTMNGVNSSILTIGTGSGHSGMTVYTGSTNEGTINFADDTSGSGTYKGMVRYDHNTNALTLHSNATEAIKIDSTGAVTMPKQPAFQARMSNAAINFSTNTVHVLAFDSEVFDNNADFNTSNYTFTAPVTGKYQLNTFFRLEEVPTDTSYIHLYFTTSNATYYDIIDPRGFDTTVAYWNLKCSVLADMDANDTAQVKIIQPNGTAQTDVASSTDSHFSGYLVC